MNLQDVSKILNNEQIREISELYLENLKAQGNTKNNIFSFISKNYHYENYHSDILTYLLSADSELFDNFIELLGLNKLDYQNTLVQKEYQIENNVKSGRIDILITDNVAKKAIIIENKMNNAVDQENQLERYYEAIKHKGFTIEKTIYLSLEGNKEPPYTEFPVEKYAAIGKNNSIYKWLNNYNNKLIEANDFKTNNNKKDLFSIIYQYLKLLKNLKGEVMNDQIMDKLLDYFKENKRDLHTLFSLYQIIENNNFDIFLMKKIASKLNIDQDEIKTLKENSETWTYIQFEKQTNNEVFVFELNKYSSPKYKEVFILLFRTENEASANLIETSEKFLSSIGIKFSEKEKELISEVNEHWHYCNIIKISDIDKVVELAYKFKNKLYTSE
ncbi:MAG: PD-(D/E)XK nuclease family protein [Bacteroidales bacterium]|nr:PD-(D/E)XK nuclease family protein [Bacteroidales bacterium]